jgi:hypothetical protein
LIPSWRLKAAIVAGSFFVSLAFVEAGFRIYEHFASPTATGDYPRAFLHRDPELGYAITPGAEAHHRRAFRGETIYDVKYTANEYGARFTRGNSKGPTWLFMGCSFTFGEGLNDDETLPSQVSKALGYRANVVNYGTSGYGPHQVLRELELKKFPDSILPVRHVVFQTIEAHVRRSAGRARWDLTGPRYQLSGDTVVHHGSFHSPRFVGFIARLGKSAAVRFFMDRYYFDQSFSDRDLELYGRIVERSARLARDNLGADFTILFWDDSTPGAARILARLEKTGLPLLRVSSVIPRSRFSEYKYPHDNHPLAKANVLLGTYVARSLAGSDIPGSPVR